MTDTRQVYAVATQAVQAGGQSFTPGQVDLIKRTIAKDASDDELKLFLYQCERTGLDPFSRQIHFVSRWDDSQKRKVGVIQTGIDGFRAVADRTSQYAGNDNPIFEYDGTSKQEYPTSASVTIWKLVNGVRCPFTATARWDEYYPGEKQGFMWRKMPHLMLSKCAEALALRKGFPLQLSGLYAPEEMDQAGRIVEDEPHRIDSPRAKAVETETVVAAEPGPITNEGPKLWPKDATGHNGWWSKMIGEAVQLGYKDHAAIIAKLTELHYDPAAMDFDHAASILAELKRAQEA